MGQSKKIRVGIIGCGAIGADIARACQDTLAGKVELTYICDMDNEKAARLNASLKKKLSIVGLDELIEKVDLVVEAASVNVSASVVEKCISKKKDCLIMSTGGLIGREELLKSAERDNIKVFIPSGAICGIDGLKSASIGKIDSITLTTRKPPKGLEGAPYLKLKNIKLSDIREETVLFDGDAAEAIKAFPQNVKDSTILSLAGLGAKNTRVKIITSPEYTKNVHEIEIKGEFGAITTKTENVPSKTNPKTSALAVFSAIATLKGITSSVRVGT